MLYQLSYEATDVGSRSIVGHMFPWKKWVLIIYEINHIWTAEVKWKWRKERRSKRNLCNCVKKPEKNSGLQRGLNPWPRDTGAMLYQLSYEATDVMMNYARAFSQSEMEKYREWIIMWFVHISEAFYLGR